MTDSRYRVFDITLMPQRDGKVLVRSPRTGVTRLLSASQAELLLACDTYRELRDHARRNWLLGEALYNDSTVSSTDASPGDRITQVELLLRTFVEDDLMHIQIRNTGQYNNGQLNSNSGFGIKNTLQRLKLIYGNTADFKIFNENSHTVLTIVKIPKLQNYESINN